MPVHALPALEVRGSIWSDNPAVQAFPPSDMVIEYQALIEGSSPFFVASLTFTRLWISPYPVLCPTIMCIVQTLGILATGVMHTVHLLLQLAFGHPFAHAASHIGAVRTTRRTTQNYTGLGVESLVACVDRPDWVSPHPPQKLQKRDCDLAIEDLWDQIPQWGARSVEWFDKRQPRFPGYPTFELPVFAHRRDCLVTVDTLAEFGQSPDWIPELPRPGDVRPWPPPRSDIAMTADIEEGLEDVMSQCVERTGVGGYARFGDCDQALGVFIWGTDSLIDHWMYGEDFEHQNRTAILNDSVATT